MEGQPTRAFRYRDKGSLATIGRNRAVALLGRVKLSGWLAWAAWLFIHILFLIGFRNRLVVLVDWAFSYITYQRHARLLLGAAPPWLAPPTAAQEPAGSGTFGRRSPS